MYIILLVLLKNINCQGDFNEYHNLCFEQKYEKYQSSLSEMFHFFGRKISSIFEKASFCNGGEQK